MEAGPDGLPEGHSPVFDGLLDQAPRDSPHWFSLPIWHGWETPPPSWMSRPSSSGHQDYITDSPYTNGLLPSDHVNFAHVSPEIEDLIMLDDDDTGGVPLENNPCIVNMAASTRLVHGDSLSTHARSSLPVLDTPLSQQLRSGGGVMLPSEVMRDRFVPTCNLDDIEAPAIRHNMEYLQDVRREEFEARRTLTPSAISTFQTATNRDNYHFRSTPWSFIANEPPEPLYNETIVLNETKLDYNVLDFLDAWQYQDYISGNPRPIRLGPTWLEDWQMPCHISDADLRQSDRDMQALDWSALGTDRRSARATRMSLYPLRTFFNKQHQSSYRSPTPMAAHFYQFRRNYPAHKALSIHFQLRHVLAATDRNGIFYASRNKVIRTSLACPGVADTVIDLSGNVSGRAAADCLITTIAASPVSPFIGYQSDSVVVAGGFRGEYALLNLNSADQSPATEGFVNQAADGITTHVHTLPRRSGGLAAAFCSNDRKLHLLDVSTNTFSSVFSYSDKLNCSATSPDGRLRALVGDTCHTLITDAERGDVLYKLKEHSEHAFATAWAEDGRHVATGAQDGRVIIHDARNWARPLTALQCEMGCARSLQFTRLSGGGFALVVAESDDIVSIYDAAGWNRKQSVDFFGSVAGVAALDGGRELVVSNGDQTVGGLMVFERSDVGVDADFADHEYDRSEPENMGRKGGKCQRGNNPGEYWQYQPKKLGLSLEEVLV